MRRIRCAEGRLELREPGSKTPCPVGEERGQSPVDEIYRVRLSGTRRRPAGDDLRRDGVDVGRIGGAQELESQRRGGRRRLRGMMRGIRDRGPLRRDPRAGQPSTARAQKRTPRIVLSIAGWIHERSLKMRIERALDAT